MHESQFAATFGPASGPHDPASLFGGGGAGEHVPPAGTQAFTCSPLLAIAGRHASSTSHEVLVQSSAQKVLVPIFAHAAFGWQSNAVAHGSQSSGCSTPLSETPPRSTFFPQAITATSAAAANDHVDELGNVRPRQGATEPRSARTRAACALVGWALKKRVPTRAAPARSPAKIRASTRRTSASSTNDPSGKRAS